MTGCEFRASSYHHIQPDASQPSRFRLPLSATSSGPFLSYVCIEKEQRHGGLKR